MSNTSSPIPRETKRFSIRDGLGVKLWQKAGHRFGIITGRTSRIVQTRAAELGIDLVRQGFEDKLPVAQEIMELLGLTPEEVCYIGDDLPDLPVIRRVGLGVAVADADAAVQNASDHATTTPGGAGAVRELIETILKQQGRWDHLVQKYF